MIIHEAKQNTFEWLAARAGIPTASELDNLVTPLFEVRKGEMPKSYLAMKIAEKWLGGPLPGANVLDMELGKILEEEALPFFELETGRAVERVGFCKTDDGRFGCSPDGLLGDDSGIEIKCPLAKTHCKTLLDGVVPKEHLTQIHGALYVTGRPRWVFMSYCRHFPPLILTVERDETIQQSISDALDTFLQNFDAAWEKILDRNGGPPTRRERPEETAPMQPSAFW